MGDFFSLLEKQEQAQKQAQIMQEDNYSVVKTVECSDEASTRASARYRFFPFFLAFALVLTLDFASENKTDCKCNFLGFLLCFTLHLIVKTSFTGFLPVLNLLVLLSLARYTTPYVPSSILFNHTNSSETLRQPCIAGR